MIVREIRREFGMRFEVLVNYRTGKLIKKKSRKRTADPWVEHWSLSMGARTDEHAREIGEKCRAANVPCRFDKMLRLKVDNPKHQQRLADAIFGKGKVSNHDRYY